MTGRSCRCRCCVPLSEAGAYPRGVASADRIYLGAMVVATVATWSTARFLTRKPSQQRRVDYLPLRLLMIASWFYSVVPSLLQVAYFGRPRSLNVADQTLLVGYAAKASFVANLALVATAAACAAHYSFAKHRAATDGTMARLVVALLPWLTMLFAAALFAAEFHAKVIVYPLIAVAIWQAAPPLRVFSTLGYLTFVTAVLSLCLGWFTDYGTVTAAALVDKALVGDTVLAGPLSHGNSLGTMLALGLPVVLLIESRRTRSVAVAAVVVAVVWSASRTSIAAVAATLVLVLIGPLARSPAARRYAVGLTLAAIVAVLAWIPLTTSSLYSYNYRGRVWIGSLRRWADSPLLGAGPDAYRAPGAYSSELGQYAFHGHNMLVNSLAVGGWIMLAAVALLVLVASRLSSRAYAAGVTFPFLWLATFLCVGILEVPTTFWLPGPSDLVVWLSLSAVLFGGWSRTAAPEALGAAYIGCDSRLTAA